MGTTSTPRVPGRRRRRGTASKVVATSATAFATIATTGAIATASHLPTPVADPSTPILRATTPGAPPAPIVLEIHRRIVRRSAVNAARTTASTSSAPTRAHTAQRATDSAATAPATRSNPGTAVPSAVAPPPAPTVTAAPPPPVTSTHGSTP